MADDKVLTGKKRSRSEAAAAAPPAAEHDSDAEGGDAKKAAVQGPTAPIAVPMAGKKLHKKVYKVVTKAAKAKALRRGVKEVVKAIRKGQSGCVRRARATRRAASAQWGRRAVCGCGPALENWVDGGGSGCTRTCLRAVYGPRARRSAVVQCARARSGSGGGYAAQFSLSRHPRRR